MVSNRRSILLGSLALVLVLVATGCSSNGDVDAKPDPGATSVEDGGDGSTQPEEASASSPLDWINYDVIYGTPYPDGFVMLRAFSRNGFVCGGTAFQPKYFADSSDPRTALDPAELSAMFQKKHDLESGKYCFSTPTDDDDYTPSLISDDGLVVTGDPPSVEYQLVDSGDDWIDVSRTDLENGTTEVERWSIIPGTSTNQ